MLPVIYLLALHLLPPEFRLEGVRLTEERRKMMEHVGKKMEKAEQHGQKHLEIELERLGEV